MATSAQQEDSGRVNAVEQNLQRYLKARSNSSNDCLWLHELLLSAAASAEKVDPISHVRLHFQGRGDSETTTTKDFGSGSYAMTDLKRCLASKHLRAVILCHRDSSRVDPKIVNLLWTKFRVNVSFLRQHFDYKGFVNETGCPEIIRNSLKEESGVIEDCWAFGGRWNPIRLPSETQASILRLSVDSECLSLCHRDGVVIVLVRSLGVYQIPSEISQKSVYFDNGCLPCTTDLYAATAETLFNSCDIPGDLSKFSHSITHFYSRLLILRCYEDFSLRHDLEPTNLTKSDRIVETSYIEAMHLRQLELVKFKRDLKGYLGPLAFGHKPNSNSQDFDLRTDVYHRKFQGLFTDIEMLLSLYDHTMKIYEWHINAMNSKDRQELASEQLEEARESRATAISLGKLSNIAFFYLPLNFVCAVLGMNLAIFGQGKVPIWAFFILIAFFSLLTFLPFIKLDSRRGRLNKVAYHLAWRSPSAAFWFLAFTFTHTHRQNFEVLNSGLAQVFLEYDVQRTKGWIDGRNDSTFDKSLCGSKAFWKGKVQKIFRAVEELNSNNKPPELVV